jgi:hypothetical protein
VSEVSLVRFEGGKGISRRENLRRARERSEERERIGGRKNRPPFFGVFCVVVSFSQANVSCPSVLLVVLEHPELTPLSSCCPSLVPRRFDLDLEPLNPFSFSPPLASLTLATEICTVEPIPTPFLSTLTTARSSQPDRCPRSTSPERLRSFSRVATLAARSSSSVNLTREPR